jgi:hypothetical protein
MAVLDELASYLQAEGLGTVGTSIFKGSIPLNGPDTLVALIEIPGFPPTHAHDATRYEQPVLQVAVRGSAHGYATARQQAQDAWNVLDGVHNVVLSGTAYLWLQALQSPYWLKSDDFHRPVFVFSVRCARALP